MTYKLTEALSIFWLGAIDALTGKACEPCLDAMVVDAHLGRKSSAKAHKCRPVAFGDCPCPCMCAECSGGDHEICMMPLGHNTRGVAYPTTDIGKCCCEPA